jgi:hypothetical protein
MVIDADILSASSGAANDSSPRQHVVDRDAVLREREQHAVIADARATKRRPALWLP